MELNILFKRTLYSCKEQSYDCCLVSHVIIKIFIINKISLDTFDNHDVTELQNLQRLWYGAAKNYLLEFLLKLIIIIILLLKLQ